MEMELRLPEWLQTWLNLPFYDDGEKCKVHIKHYNTIYCITCMEGPLCHTCWEKSKHHDNDDDHHHVLHVKRASERASIEVNDIREFVDISKIQPYIINGNRVVFLNPHVEGASDASQKPCCQTCQRRLKKSDEFKGYKFCSIACKIQHRDMEIENNNDEPEQATANRAGSRKSGVNIIDQCFFVSRRKGRRKGIPCRAALK